MGHICHQLRLHALALYLRVHGLFQAFLNLKNLFPERLKDSQILIDGHIQPALCNLIHGPEQNPVRILQPADIFSQDKVQHHRIRHRYAQPPKPQTADKEKDHCIHQNQFHNHLVGVPGQIHMGHSLVKTHQISFHKREETIENTPLLNIFFHSQLPKRPGTDTHIPAAEEKRRQHRQIQSTRYKPCALRIVQMSGKYPPCPAAGHKCHHTDHIIHNRTQSDHNTRQHFQGDRTDPLLLPGFFLPRKREKKPSQSHQGHDDKQKSTHAHIQIGMEYPSLPLVDSHRVIPLVIRHFHGDRLYPAVPSHACPGLIGNGKCDRTVHRPFHRHVASQFLPDIHNTAQNIFPQCLPRMPADCALIGAADILPQGHVPHAVKGETQQKMLFLQPPFPFLRRHVGEIPFCGIILDNIVVTAVEMTETVLQALEIIPQTL